MDQLLKAADATKAAAKPAEGAARQILFSVCKHETHSPQNGFKRLFRRLRSSYKCALLRDELTEEKLAEASLVIFGGPREKFTTTEFDSLKEYMKKGGSVLFLMASAARVRGSRCEATSVQLRTAAGSVPPRP